MGTRSTIAQSDGRAPANRSDGKVDRQLERHQNERRAVAEWIEVIANSSQLRELLPQLQSVARVAIDTEADSLHCYREKLCLLQISVPGGDFIVDPLADVDLAPLREALGEKELVLHGADYDLRLLRRNLDFVPKRIFDTVIAARMLGAREFSYAALVKRYFEVELAKGS